MKFTIPIPFVEALGFELLRCEGGEAEVAVPPRPDLLNHLAIAHGGVVMTLLDVAMAHAVRATDPALLTGGPALVTIEMKTSFIRPGNGRLRAVGRVLRKATSMAFCEGSVFDDAGELVAHATGTFKLIRKRPGGAPPAPALPTPASPA